jgi:hypothetical protein
MNKPLTRWGILGAANIARKNWKAIWNSGNGIITAAHDDRRGLRALRRGGEARGERVCRIRKNDEV